MNFPKKIPFQNRINKQTNGTMLVKAINNAGVGFPMSALLNVGFTLPISAWFLTQNLPTWSYPFILGAPFVIVSVVRQFLIDYYMAVYNINLDPSYLIKIGIKKLLNKTKGIEN